MFMELMRLRDDGDSTIGTLHVNGKFECFTLEDEHRDIKVSGETRIPRGSYEIKLRTEGGMNEKYFNRYGGFHKGMLWLQNVENFEWIYIHTGGTDDHTEGCILVGRGCDSTEGRQRVSGSSFAYYELYKKAIEAFDRGERVTINII